MRGDSHPARFPNWATEVLWQRQPVSSLPGNMGAITKKAISIRIISWVELRAWSTWQSIRYTAILESQAFVRMIHIWSVFCHRKMLFCIPLQFLNRVKITRKGKSVDAFKKLNSTLIPSASPLVKGGAKLQIPTSQVALIFFSLLFLVCKEMFAFWHIKYNPTCLKHLRWRHYCTTSLRSTSRRLWRPPGLHKQAV